MGKTKIVHEFETKYGIDDIVFYISHNKIVKSKIIGINFFKGKDNFGLKKLIYHLDDQTDICESDISLSVEDLYKEKV